MCLMYHDAKSSQDNVFGYLPKSSQRHRLYMMQNMKVFRIEISKEVLELPTE